ncbi:MAG: hypothetical protein IKF79_09980 [Methanosphaera sp.]|nr:hypothetical protein [Methanosphaera sp.]
MVLGTIFIGGVHDFFSGFMSLRNDGSTMPNIISKYLGSPIRKIMAVLIVITGIVSCPDIVNCVFISYNNSIFSLHPISSFTMNLFAGFLSLFNSSADKKSPS